MKQNGQIVIILLLIMLVGLTVGLAITQRSVINVSNSNKTEESSRAFSVAEAGLEQALYSGSLNSVSIPENQAGANVTSSPALPATGQPLEYPPIGKETTAQFWLADPNNNLACSGSNGTYCPSSFDVYFGRFNPPTDPRDSDTAAIEVTLISKSATNYNITKYYFDPLTAIRTPSNGFSDPNNCLTSSPTPVDSGINTSNSPDTTIRDRYFRCKETVNYTGTDTPIMLRIRILYSSQAQPIAVSPPVGKSLPPQAVIFTSVGTAGVTQRKLQVFRLPYVVPFYFDYSIFSAGSINKWKKTQGSRWWNYY